MCEDHLGWSSRSGNRSSIQRLRQYNETTMADQGLAPPRATRHSPGVYAACHVQQLKEAQVPQVPQTFFDALAVRTWCGLALAALGRAREEIDAINVYPVADGDTGTNLYLTLESAYAAVEAAFAGHEAGAGASGPSGAPTLADAARAMAHGALIGARGNSGTILAQLLRGMAQVLAAEADGETGGESAHVDGPGLCLALRHAADAAREAVAHPVEGTVLTVASAAADAATEAEGDCGTVARAAYEGASAALAATPGQLAVLGRAGVVDAGGQGLVTVLGALVETFRGRRRGVLGRGRHACECLCGTPMLMLLTSRSTARTRATPPVPRSR